MRQTSYDAGRLSLMAEIRSLPALLAGRGVDPAGVVATALQAVGVEALSIIKGAFVVKAGGSEDEAGIKWAPLSPKTIAYGRRHGPALTRKRAAAAKVGRQRRPLLTAQQDRRWRAIYAGALAKGMKPGDAAARAWAILKSQGGQTILGKYGDAPAQPLRDTGRLLNSFSPGNPDNLLDARPGLVKVGSNVVYAGAHHHGNPARKLPARPFWPEVWPDVWVNRLGEALKDAVAAVLAARLRG